MNREFYLNITYACNNDCIICASNSYKNNINSPIIELQMFKEIIDSNNIESNDTVVINGGEPTVHPSFEDIVNLCKKQNIFIYLFTNGKKFANKNYAKRILKKFKGRIAIPFYSHLENHHDKITNSIGSFKASVKGVKNISQIIRKERAKGNKIELELKTLILRSNMNELENIASFVLKNFSFEHFLISGPYISKKAILQGKDELVNLSSCSSQISNCINFFSENSNVQVHCYFIPLCILGNIKYENVCSNSNYKSDRECDFYFDPYNPNGMVWTNDKSFSPNCIKCKYFNDCQGVWNSYYNYFGSNELKPIS